MNKISILKLLFSVSLLSCALSQQNLFSADSPDSTEAKRSLLLGNERFVSEESIHPNLQMDHRASLAAGQTPFATVIACSDSRVSPELIFDQGLGDLFVIRVAGNVADVDEVGSIEYGIGHLNTPLLVVLGHTHCGAVTAVAQSHEVHGSIPQLVDNISPAVARARAKATKASQADLVAHAVVENVWVSIEDLLDRSEVARSLLQAGSLRVVGAVYDIETGQVDWLGEHPKQSELVARAVSSERQDIHEQEYSDQHEALDLDFLEMKPVETNTLHWVLVGLGGLLLGGASIFYACKALLPKWRVGHRLGAGFSGMVALVLLAGGIGFEGMLTAYRDFEAYRSDSRRTILLSEIDIAFLEAEIAANDFASDGSNRSRDILAEELQSLRQICEKIPVHFDDKQHLATLKEVTDSLALYDKLFSEIGDETASAKRKTVLANMDALAGQVEGSLIELTNKIVKRQTDAEPVILSDLLDSKTLVAMVSVVSVLIGLFLSVSISRSIIKPLGSISEDLQNGAHQTSVVASQVSSTSQDLAQGSAEQAASVEEASASLEEIDSIVSSISESLQQTDELMGDVRQAVGEGVKRMSDMSQAMDDIQHASNAVGNIVKTIDEIAFQTNILALNASVEAARAGSAGSGFAVVADEVRNLAKRCADATRNTASQIESTIATTVVGVEITSELGKSLSEIMERTENIAKRTHEQARSVSEQRSGVRQLNLAMRQIDTVGQQNASISEESAAAAEELSSQSELLNETVIELRRLVSGVSSRPKAQVGIAKRVRTNRSRIDHSQPLSFN
ncbi:carbonic anhydrase [Pelagicoccus sp. SDUM812003]|uniref:carbonic anhydrase n=1 Tax=Pelagicoccus sp. SDUM812003 TaxID=3041267 RepID=UPI00280E02F5|nr:carbonic anhydrase [Pelagicoccus sp. SDUM812003]MDQ8202183.1 carbonic anhydrase [Pelagicoccus sp. SDUM812003]